MGFLGSSVVKNLPANAGAAGEVDLIPGSGRSPGGGNGTYPSILAWEMPWPEETAGYSPWGGKELDTASDRVLSHT